MGDIDFDELDKAVNSVMKQTTGAQPTADGSAAEQQLESTSEPAMTSPTSTESEQPQQADQTTPEVAQESTQPAQETTPTLEQSSSTTQLDSSAPASMTPPTPGEASTQPEEPPVDTKAAVDTTPTSTEKNSEQDAPTEEVGAAPDVPQADNAVPSGDVKPVKRSGRFMDVVHPSSDMGTANNVPDMSPTTDRKGATISPPSQPAAPETPTATTPSEEATTPKSPTTPPNTPEPDSPFLPDAKVEKRPLGPVTADAARTDIDTQQSGTTPNSEASTPPSGPLPDELKGELVSLDAAEHTQPAQSAAPNDQFQTPEKTVNQPEEHAAIFSPDAHAPLAHSKKKRSSVMIIAVIVGLILVGVIGATALYMLDVL